MNEQKNWCVVQSGQKILTGLTENDAKQQVQSRNALLLEHKEDGKPAKPLFEAKQILLG